MYFLYMYKAKALALYKMLDQDAFSCTVWYCVRGMTLYYKKLLFLHYIRMHIAHSCIINDSARTNTSHGHNVIAESCGECTVHCTLYSTYHCCTSTCARCDLGSWFRLMCTRVHCDLKDDPDVHVYTMTWKVTLMYTCTCTMTWNVTLVYMCIVYTLTLV